MELGPFMRCCDSRAVKLQRGIVAKHPPARCDVGACCCAGWFNLLGQAAVTAGIDFALASHIQGMWVLSNGYVLSQKELLAVYASELQRSSLSCSQHRSAHMMVEMRRPMKAS